MDNICSWNVRGLNEQSRQFEVRSLLKNNKVSLAGLLETKIRSCNFDKLIRSFPEWDYINNYDRCLFGRLLVLWKKSVVSVRPLNRSDQMIHCYVTFLNELVSCYITFIYAANEPVERTPLWDELRIVGQNISEPWLILGDFNTTLLHDERVREGEIVACSTAELENLTMNCGVADLRYNGLRFTWSDRRVRRLFCKLDRALVNAQWQSSFEESEATFLPTGSSDHSPCVVRVLRRAEKRNHIFKFCDMWTRNDNFLNLVKEAWNTRVSGTPMFKVVRKLKQVKLNLKALHRTEYDRIAEKVKAKKTELDEIQMALAVQQTIELQEKERALKEEYQQLVSIELQLPQQRAKVEWLKLNDTNSPYFHAKLKEKRAQNRIISVHTEDGVLLTENTVITEIEVL